jgi:hypothetical protein
MMLICQKYRRLVDGSNKMITVEKNQQREGEREREGEGGDL